MTNQRGRVGTDQVTRIAPGRGSAVTVTSSGAGIASAGPDGEGDQGQVLLRLALI